MFDAIPGGIHRNLLKTSLKLTVLARFVMTRYSECVLKTGHGLVYDLYRPKGIFRWPPPILHILRCVGYAIVCTREFALFLVLIRWKIRELCANPIFDWWPLSIVVTHSCVRATVTMFLSFALHYPDLLVLQDFPR